METNMLIYHFDKIFLGYGAQQPPKQFLSLMQYNHGVVDRSGNKKLMFFYFSFQEKKIITLSNEIKLQFSPAVVKI